MKHHTVSDNVLNIHPTLQGPDPRYIHIPAEDWAMLQAHVPQPIDNQGHLTHWAVTYLNRRATQREAELQRQQDERRDRAPKWYE